MLMSVVLAFLLFEIIKISVVVKPLLFTYRKEDRMSVSIYLW